MNLKICVGTWNVKSRLVCFTWNRHTHIFQLCSLCFCFHHKLLFLAFPYNLLRHGKTCRVEVTDLFCQVRFILFCFFVTIHFWAIWYLILMWNWGYKGPIQIKMEYVEPLLVCVCVCFQLHWLCFGNPTVLTDWHFIRHVMH